MKHLLFIIILFALCGCNHLKDAKPADLISQEQMTEILVDIHVADAIIDQKYGSQIANASLNNALYTRIFQNYHVTMSQYKSSYEYYERHPVLMDKMYVQVITELSKKEAVMSK